MQVSCQTGQDWPLLFRNDDNRPWYFRYWCEVNTGTPWKVMVSQSQTVHSNNQRISGFHGPAVCDLDNTPEVILSKCLIWGWLPPHIFLPICAQHVALFSPHPERSDFHDQKLCQLHSDLIKKEVRGYLSFGLITFSEGYTKTRLLSLASAARSLCTSEGLLVFDVPREIGL